MMEMLEKPQTTQINNTPYPFVENFQAFKTSTQLSQI